MAELLKDGPLVSSAFLLFLRRRGLTMSVLEKFKDSSFMEHLRGNLLLATFFISLILLIVMLLSRSLY